MKAVKRLRALRVDVGEVMMGVKKLWEEKKIWKRNSFLQADASNFVQEDLEVKDQNFGERYLALAKDFGKLFMTIIYRHTFALKST